MEPTYLTQEKLRDFFKELTGHRANIPTIKSAIANGLPHIRLGKRMYFSKESVLVWLKSQENKSQTYIKSRR